MASIEGKLMRNKPEVQGVYARARDFMAVIKSLQRSQAFAFCIAVALRCSTLAVAQSASKCMIAGTPQVDPVLVRLELRSTGSVYKRGKPVRVTARLQAGAKGVYLPDFFGSFRETCLYGFASELLTRQGSAADPDERGCAYAGPMPRVKYVELMPGETRTWSIDLSTVSIAPGHYCLSAEYLSGERLIDWATNPPKNRALVASGQVSAEPMYIEIR